LIGFITVLICLGEPGIRKSIFPATHFEGYFTSRGSIYCAYKLCPSKVVHVLTCTTAKTAKETRKEIRL
jgi:hypothetical protein